MERIQVPLSTHPWSTVADVARHFRSDEWLLTGGLMVQAHAMIHGLPSRATEDADFLLNILAYDRIASQMQSFLGTLGFELEDGTMSGYASRFSTESKDKVDLMVTDYVFGKDKRRNASLMGRPLCGMPGGGQAIQRRQRILFDYGGEELHITIPDLPGSVMLKSAAWMVDKTSRRNRHLRDAALLLSLIEDPVAQIKRLHSRNDRKRIILLADRLGEDSDFWDRLDAAHRQSGLDTLDVFLEWAEMTD